MKKKRTLIFDVIEMTAHIRYIRVRFFFGVTGSNTHLSLVGIRFEFPSKMQTW